MLGGTVRDSGSREFQGRLVSGNLRYVRFDVIDGREQMRTLKVERGKRTPATDAAFLVDCGRASERTRGVPLLLLFELGTPPANKLFLF